MKSILLVFLTMLIPAISQSQLNKNIWKVSLAQGFAGFADGTNQAYLFHYGNSGLFEQWGIRPNEEAWRNKWAKDVNGNTIVGTEKFWLSSTALVWTTDFHHLTRFAKHRADEVSMMYYATGHGIKKFYWLDGNSNKESRQARRKNWYWYAADMAIAFAARSVGFYASYNLIFK